MRLILDSRDYGHAHYLIGDNGKTGPDRIYVDELIPLEGDPKVIAAALRRFANSIETWLVEPQKD